MSSSKSALRELHDSHLEEAGNMRKHVSTRTYHVLMAQMYYQLWKDAPWDGT